MRKAFPQHWQGRKAIKEKRSSREHELGTGNAGDSGRCFSESSATVHAHIAYAWYPYRIFLEKTRIVLDFNSKP